MEALILLLPTDTVEVKDISLSPRLGDGLRVSPAALDTELVGVEVAGSARTCWGMMAWSVLADFAETVDGSFFLAAVRDYLSRKNRYRSSSRECVVHLD